MTDAEAQIIRESTYLGDGVYVHVDRVRQLVTLLTSDGERVTNRVHLGPHTLAAFTTWLDGVRGER